MLNAQGTDAQHVIFTALEDDSVGGDSNLDGNTSLPMLGEWGITIQGSGWFNSNSDTEVRDVQTAESGSLAIYQTWLGSQLYHITSDVTIPSGVVLTIQPGAVIKFDANTSIVLQPGSQLIAAGTVAQPIYFTSIKDDSIAGDTNGDGNATSPAAGNWRWILGERQRPLNPGPRLDQLRRGQQQPNMEQHWRNSHRRHGFRHRLQQHYPAGALRWH